MNPFLSFDLSGPSDEEDDASQGAILSHSKLLNSLRQDFRDLGLTWEGQPDRSTVLDHHPTFIWADMQCTSYILSLAYLILSTVFLCSERGRRTTDNRPTFTGRQVEERKREVRIQMEAFENAAQQAEDLMQDLVHQGQTLRQRKREEQRAEEKDEAVIEGIAMDLSTIEGRIQRAQQQWAEAAQGSNGLVHVLADLEALYLIAQTCLTR